MTNSGIRRGYNTVSYQFTGYPLITFSKKDLLAPYSRVKVEYRTTLSVAAWSSINEWANEERDRLNGTVSETPTLFCI